MQLWTNPNRPNYVPASELYSKALEELLIPYPSTPIGLFPGLNRITGGLRPREFTILCGSTGSGKTTFAANLSHSFLMSGTPHFVASVETGPTDFLKRTICSIMRQDWNGGDPVPLHLVQDFDLKHGHFYDKETLNLSLYENRFSVETLTNDIQWMVENKGIKVAIIDNLNFFLEVTPDTSQVVEMDRVVHSLIVFCKQIDVHIIMVMHPKKTDHGRVNDEFDIKGSSTAVQEAHNIFLWNRISQELINDGCNKNDRELKIVKMRRRGLSIGKKLIFTTDNGVNYTEGKIY